MYLLGPRGGGSEWIEGIDGKNLKGYGLDNCRETVSRSLLQYTSRRKGLILCGIRRSGVSSDIFKLRNQRVDRAMTFLIHVGCEALHSIYTGDVFNWWKYRDAIDSTRRAGVCRPPSYSLGVDVYLNCGTLIKPNVNYTGVIEGLPPKWCCGRATTSWLMYLPRAWAVYYFRDGLIGELFKVTKTNPVKFSKAPVLFSYMFNTLSETLRYGMHGRLYFWEFYFTLLQTARYPEHQQKIKSLLRDSHANGYKNWVARNSRELRILPGFVETSKQLKPYFDKSREVRFRY